MVEIVKPDQTSFKQTCDTDWILLHLLSQNILPFPECSDITGQSVPFWTGFNSLLSKEDPEGAYTAVAYPPIIDTKPSDMSTIFTAMNKAKEESLTQGQEYSVQFMDQQLYAIAMMTK